MSILSVLRKGRKQAKDAKQQDANKNVEKAQEKPIVKQPYKHVPVHAAVDAMSGAPAGWNHEYRPRIMEQNRKRSEMQSASGVDPQSISRSGSSLSVVSFPSTRATPAVLPKNPSYISMPAVNYSTTDYFNDPVREKGKQPERAPALPLSLGRQSPLGFEVPSSSGSSVTVNSLSDFPRTRPAGHKRMASASGSMTTTDNRPVVPRQNSAGSETLHRLHPAHQRRMSQNSNSDGQSSPGTRSTHFSAPPLMNSQQMFIYDFTAPPMPDLSPLMHYSTTGMASPSASIPNSYASSAMSIGMATSTASSSAASSPATPSSPVFASPARKCFSTQDLASGPRYVVKPSNRDFAAPSERDVSTGPPRNTVRSSNHVQ